MVTTGGRSRFRQRLGHARRPLRTRPYRELHPKWLEAADEVSCFGMIDGLKLLACFVVSLFRSKGRLEAEIVVLRHQLNVLRRGMPSLARLTLIDRLIFVRPYRLRPSVLSSVVIVQPETVVRWHREGFRLYWRWKSRARRAPANPARPARSHSRDEPCQSTVGRASHSWRAPQARHRGRPVDSGQVHGARPPAAGPEAGRPFCATMLPASPR
jgi:hypothetical protein